MMKMRETVRLDIDEELASRFRAASRVAMDTETSGLDPHSDRLAVAQVHAPEVGTVIVQLGDDIPWRLCSLVADPAVLKTFHHAMFDLRFMVAHWRVTPSNIACTKVASKLLTPDGGPSEHSLQSLLKKHLGVSISKEQRLSDWSAPTITPEQLDYAANDVEHLLPLLDELLRRLGEQQLSAEYKACLAFLPTRVKLDLGGWPDVFSY